VPARSLDPLDLSVDRSTQSTVAPEDLIQASLRVYFRFTGG
jgi:hypothetical protein